MVYFLFVIKDENKLNILFYFYLFHLKQSTDLSGSLL